MLRFTIRDLLWLTIVVAMGISLYQGHVQRRRLQLELRRSVQELRDLDFRFGRLKESAAKEKVALQRLQTNSHSSSNRP